MSTIHAHHDGVKTTCDGVMIDRVCRDEVLDLDKSHGSTPTSIINQFRFVRLCGVLFEQIACDTLTGDAIFKAQ